MGQGRFLLGASAGLPASLLTQGRFCCRLFIYVLVPQLHPTLCDPMDCSPPGSSVRGILPAKILEWVAIPSSRGSSQPRDGPQVACISGRFFTN